MALVWREQLSVGNDLIDADHKNLIEIINQVEISLASKDDNKLTQMLNDLSKYSKTHFDHEERIARAVGFTQTARLHSTHEELLLKLGAFIKEVDSHWSEESREKFCALLRSWLIDHVIKEDMLLKPLLTRYPPKFDTK